MDLYKIKQNYLKALDDLEIDEETGEIINFEEVEAIVGNMEEKIENVACYIKNLSLLRDGIKNERQTLAKREKALDKKIEYLKNTIEDCMLSIGKTKFETEKVKITFRKTTVTEIFEGFLNWAMIHAEKLLNYKEPEPSKTAIKEAIKNGEDVQFAALVEKQNIQLK